MVPKKLKEELIETVVGKGTTYKTAEVDLGSRGQTKDFSRERYLSELYNKRNGSRIELI